MTQSTTERSDRHEHPAPSQPPTATDTSSSNVLVRLSPPDLFDSTSLGFSPVVIVPPDCSLVFVSGQLANDQDADFQHQVDDAFENLRVALDAAGAAPQTVVRISCLVVDHSTDRRGIVSRARRRFFDGEGPASTIIPVPRLAEPTALFEVDAIAMVDVATSSGTAHD